jgi:hypothetical protein
MYPHPLSYYLLFSSKYDLQANFSYRREAFGVSWNQTVEGIGIEPLLRVGPHSTTYFDLGKKLKFQEYIQLLRNISIGLRNIC